MNDYIENFDGEKVFIKLTKANIADILNGKVLSGFKSEILLEDTENGK